MSFIDYEIDALMKAARHIDAARFDACHDPTSPPYGQDTPHYHDNDYHVLLQNYHTLFQNLQAFVEKMVDKTTPYHDTVFITSDMEQTVKRRLDTWNTHVRKLYNVYYKALAQALYSAAEAMAATDEANTQRFHGGTIPQ